MGFWVRELGSERIDEIVATVRGHADGGDEDAAWKAAQPLLKAQRGQREAALAMARLICRGAFEIERALEAARALYAAHADDVDVVAAIADGFESLHEIRFLNGAPPEDPWFATVTDRMRTLVGQADASQRRSAFEGLATAARILGRSWDTIAEQALAQVIELEPDVWRHHYSIGLFYKARGRFAEGQAANQRAYDLGGSDRENVRWNLGICATGAGDAPTALRMWKDVLGQKIEMGRFGLPEGTYPATKVRLAQRPIAERDPQRQPDDAGEEETIWVERLSPCHGIVRSALYSDDIGVDYGDVIMFDGAPVTYHMYGDEEIPVFPHLATLQRPGYQIYRFAGTQQREQQIADLSEQLPADSVLYVHTEQLRLLCANCANGAGGDHAHQPTDQHRIVEGKLCAPPTVPARDLIAAIDAAVRTGAPEVRIYAPDLADAAGDPDRAAVDRRRLAMIEGT